jgi:hypothetical protein
MKSSLVVTAAAASYDLLTTANFKALVGITSSTEDTRIGLLITQASNIAANYCGRVFGQETVTETFRLSRVDRVSGIRRFDGMQHELEVLVLSRYPVMVTGPLPITVTEDDIVLASTDFTLDLDTGILTRLLDGLPQNWAADKVVVSYTGGYVVPAAAPGDLAHACTVIVNQMRSAMSRDPLAKRIEIPDVQTVDYWVGGVTSTGLPVEAISILDRYADVNL